MKIQGWRLPPLGAKVAASQTLRFNAAGSGADRCRRIARGVRIPGRRGTCSPLEAMAFVAAAGASRVTIDLTPTPAGTRVSLRHEFADESVRDQHVQGWRYQLSVFANVVGAELAAEKDTAAKLKKAMRKKTKTAVAAQAEPVAADSD